MKLNKKIYRFITLEKAYKLFKKGYTIIVKNNEITLIKEE